MDFVITLDRDSSIPLYSQVAEEIRQAILQGRLKPKQKLPSSRTLAESLGISRIIVTQSYEQLTSEGYLETLKGSGTYVCSQLPDHWLTNQAKERSPQNNSQLLSSLSDYGRSLIKADNSEALEPVAEISFRYGNPATEQFPVKIWRKLLSRNCHYIPAVFTIKKSDRRLFGSFSRCSLSSRTSSDYQWFSARIGLNDTLIRSAWRLGCGGRTWLY